MGIQLYRAITPFVNVLSIIDKGGKLLVEMDDIPVMDMTDFRKEYKDEPVIVTPMKFYREIYHELREFISDNKIIFLEEFGGE